TASHPLASSPDSAPNFEPSPLLAARQSLPPAPAAGLVAARASVAPFPNAWTRIADSRCLAASPAVPSTAAAFAAAASVDSPTAARAPVEWLTNPPTPLPNRYLVRSPLSTPTNPMSRPLLTTSHRRPRPRRYKQRK